MVREPISVRAISKKRDLRKFINLQWHANLANPLWAGPLISDERRSLNPHKNPALAYCEVALALAERNGRSIGRIMGIINSRHNAMSGERVARFSSFDCENIEETARALLAWLEEWARANNCVRVIGPMGFSDQDPEGMLVEGFDKEPGIATLHGPRYLPYFMEASGYKKEVDYVTYLGTTDIPKRVAKIANRVRKRSSLRLIDFTTKKELRANAHRVLSLMNDAYDGIYGYVALNEAEKADLTKRFIRYLDPRFVKVVEHDGDAVGFVIAMPHVAPGFRKAKGRLFPFGLYHILRSMKNTNQLNALLGGIKSAWRGKGVDVLLNTALADAAQKAGLTVLDSQHVLETNGPMRTYYENWGAVIYKRHRIFQKDLGLAVLPGQSARSEA